MKRKRMITNLVTAGCCVLLILQVAISVRADHGDPDPSFGWRGVKIDHSTYRNMTPRAIAQQADGKLIVAGHMTGGGHPYPMLLVRRYDTSGNVDTGFGLSGFGVEILAGQAWYIYGQADSVAIQEDGKILVAGTANIPGSNLTKPAVFRFYSWGDLDATFGDHGRVIFDDGYDWSYAEDIVIFKGKPLVRVAGIGWKALIRLNADGTRDTSFGLSGSASLGITAHSLAINRKTGKLIVGGTFNSVGSGPIPALQHFSINGVPDTTHGADGIALLDLTPLCVAYIANGVYSLDTQADGKIIAGCSCGHPNAGPYNSIVRLLPDDTLDTSFGNGGYALEVVWEEYADLIQVRVSRTTTDITAFGHVGPLSLKRYSSSGFVQFSYPAMDNVADFLIQPDEKVVTVKQVNYEDIQLKRFLR